MSDELTQKVVKTLEQQAYETWVGAFYGDFNDAVLHGYCTWEKLPKGIKEAWRVTVDVIKEGGIVWE